MRRLVRGVLGAGAVLGALLGAGVAPAQSGDGVEEAADDELLPVIALAREAEPLPEPQPAPRTVFVEEIVVTAQKRAQRMVDVPINVSALSADDLRNVRVEQVRDIAGYIPNVDIKEQVPGAIPVVTIRGIGLDDFSSTNSPAAGIYVDQVTLGSLALMSFDLYDMERIEVLKGPQGTLYGRNSTAGAINVLTARPAPERQGFLKAGYGDYKAWDLEGMLNLPLADTLALRVAAKLIRQDEGYWKSRLGADAAPPQAPLGGLLPILGGMARLPLPPLSFGQQSADDPIRRDIGKRDILLGRTRLGWEVLPDLQVDLKLEGLRQRSELGQPEAFGTLCTPGSQPVDPQNCSDALGYRDTDGDPYRGDWRGDFPYRIDQWSATATVDWSLDWATLTSVTGYIDLERFFHIDVDATPADQFDFFQTDTVQQFTQELRLASSTDALDWLVGAFWSSDEISVDTDGLHQDLIPFEQSRIDADQTTRSAAAFANLDWHLGDRLTLVSGLRYTYETRDYVGGTIWTVNIPTQVEDTFIDARIEDRNWSWRLGLNFAPTDQSLLYASVSKGVKSGGFFSGVTSNQAQLEPYAPESLIAWEIGAKLQGPLSVNASVFYYDYSDVQTFMRSSSAPVQLIGNVPEAEVYGGDLDLLWRGFDRLTLQAGLGWLRTELGSFDGPSGEPVAAGNQLANAPELTVNLLARYEQPLSAALTAAAQVDAHHAGAAFKEATNDPVIKTEAYWALNGRLSLFPTQRDWDVSLWGRNLTDERYVVQGLHVGAFFFGNRNYNAPRTYGAEISVRF
jgi:iron complex outermembrane recepter protein